MELTQDAVARGAFGSPTFFVNDEMFFGKDQLRDVEEEIVAQQKVLQHSSAPVRAG
jgi:2-hydroxychromene-2-carboxylate isomerase